MEYLILIPACLAGVFLADTIQKAYDLARLSLEVRRAEALLAKRSL